MIKLAVILLLSLSFGFGQSLRQKPSILLHHGVVWVERGLYVSMGVGQNMQWGDGSLLYVNESGGYAYAANFIGGAEVQMRGGIYHQNKFQYDSLSGNYTESKEKRIFSSETYNLNAKYFSVSDNKKSLLYLSPFGEIDIVKDQSLQIVAQDDEGPLLDPDGNNIQREFLDEKGFMVGLEVGYGERTRNYWGYNSSLTAEINLFKYGYELISRGENSPIWKVEGSFGASIDLLAVFPGAIDVLNALYLYSDSFVDYDGATLNFTYYFGSSLAF
ncbi:MAG: hypothetical protein OCC49_08520 [Fibrobacterales bacterium]